MHIVTVSNDANPGLLRLYRSIKFAGMHLTILGMGRQYRSNSDKLVYVREWLGKLSDYEIVMFLDAFDTVFVSNEARLLRQFALFDHDWVMSGELNCYPSSELAVRYPPNRCDRYGPYKYLNSGCWIGCAGYVRERLGSLGLGLGAMQCDQAILTREYLAANDLCCIDTEASIFQSMYGVHDTDVTYMDKTQVVWNHVTNKAPCVVHGNGQSSLAPAIAYLNDRGIQ